MFPLLSVVSGLGGGIPITPNDHLAYSIVYIRNSEPTSVFPSYVVSNRTVDSELGVEPSVSVNPTPNDIIITSCTNSPRIGLNEGFGVYSDSFGVNYTQVTPENQDNNAFCSAYSDDFSTPSRALLAGFIQGSVPLSDNDAISVMHFYTSNTGDLTVPDNSAGQVVDSQGVLDVILSEDAQIGDWVVVSVMSASSVNIPVGGVNVDGVFTISGVNINTPPENIGQRISIFRKQLTPIDIDRGMLPIRPYNYTTPLPDSTRPTGVPSTAIDFTDSPLLEFESLYTSMSQNSWTNGGIVTSESAMFTEFSILEIRTPPLDQIISGKEVKGVYVGYVYPSFEEQGAQGTTESTLSLLGVDGRTVSDGILYNASDNLGFIHIDNIGTNQETSFLIQLEEILLNDGISILGGVRIPYIFLDFVDTPTT